MSDDIKTFARKHAPEMGENVISLFKRILEKHDAALLEVVCEQQNRIKELEEALAKREAVAFVPYTPEQLKEYYPVMCNKCGWRGLSIECAGGGAIADTGDYEDIYCPKCWDFEHGGTKSEPREVVIVAAPQFAHEGGLAVAKGLTVVPQSWIYAATKAKQLTPDVCKAYPGAASAHITGLASLILQLAASQQAAKGEGT